MAKRLANIKAVVDLSGEGFAQYLKKILDPEVTAVINRLSKKTNLYIFSGVIRNYFLGYSSIRDIDIVTQDDIVIESILKKYKVNRNSFGGYKIQVGRTKMDLWSLHNTWAIKQGGTPIGFSLDQYIPYTAFFNFSAVVFSYREKSFLYHKAFLSFLRDKKINYVHKPNANIALCIVNTFYYADKYKLGIAHKLMRYVVGMHRSGNRDYIKVQTKHFGKVLYSASDINKRVIQLAETLEAIKRNKAKSKIVRNSHKSPLLPPWILNTAT